MKKNKGTVPHIYLDQLPQDIQDGVSKNGFTLYKNVMIVWSEMDKTDEVLRFIDGLSEDIRKELLLVSNQNGSVDFVWNDKTPSSFHLYKVKMSRKMYQVFHFSYIIKR